VARKPSPTLTDAELRLMQVIWERGPSTVSDVVDALERISADTGEPGLAYTSVLTTMRILEKKGYLRHERRARAFVYRPLVDRQNVQRSVLRYVMSRFFSNSAEELVLNVLEDEQLSPEELERLKKLMEKEQER
jgi:BlaI family transcriptional regulator, penicillinase repressor